MKRTSLRSFDRFIQRRRTMMKAFRFVTAGAIAAVALALAAAQEAARQPISLELLVPADARVEFNGKNTTEAGERRTFATPALEVGKEYTYGVTVTFRGKVVQRDITVSHKGKNSFDLRPDFAGAGPGNPEAEAAIQKQAEAFVEAFHKGDARAVAACWVADGDFIDQTGRHVKGREAIEQAFAALFAEDKGLKLRVEGTSLRFVTPDVAIEDGTTEVFPSDGGPPTKGRYSNVHVKKDGQWLLSAVRTAPFTPPGNLQNLRGLGWLVGDWAGEAEEGAVERLAAAWSDNQNFITGTFSTTVKHVPVASATHRVGWDPDAKRIRSWVFDASGGFGEGTWAQDGKKWVVKTTSVLQDGKKAAATYVLTPVDADTLTLQAKDRSEDGKPVPDSKEIRLKRVK
jgi:uncharacterized protein (TIGR02246 family)